VWLMQFAHQNNVLGVYIDMMLTVNGVVKYFFLERHVITS
jgi:hypothetical protein